MTNVFQFISIQFQSRTRHVTLRAIFWSVGRSIRRSADAARVHMTGPLHHCSCPPVAQRLPDPALMRMGMYIFADKHKGLRQSRQANRHTNRLLDKRKMNNEPAKNKVIRPKSRSSAFSKKCQANRQANNFFFSKRHNIKSFLPFSNMKYALKSL